MSHQRYFLACAALSALMLTGCGGWERRKLTGCDHPSGVCTEIRDVAQRSYLMAQLAQNAYADNDFRLLPNVRELKEFAIDDRKSGFGARVYEVSPLTEPAFLAIAFRGTNFEELHDWTRGNLTDAQYRQGQALFGDVRAKHPGRQLVMTGHSLGAAIASYVSLREDNAPVFGFDPSTRFTRGLGKTNDREYVAQYGEVLKGLRLLTINSAGTYTVIDCNDGNFISRHSLRPLAECLTRIAALSGAEDAKASVQLNEIPTAGRIFDQIIAE
jgi:hypothetical protein